MDDLLLKYIKGEASAEEKKQVVRWIDENPQNMRRYLSMRKLYDITLWSEGEKNGEKQQFHLRHMAIVLLKYVAVLIVAFSGAVFYLIQKDNTIEMQTVFVPCGQRAEVMLADGTKVWLNSLSTFRFPNRFSESMRNVELFHYGLPQNNPLHPTPPSAYFPKNDGGNGT